MSAFQRFEATEVGKMHERKLTRARYALSNDGQCAHDFGLRDQISTKR